MTGTLLKQRWSLRYGGIILITFGLAAGAVMYPTFQRALSEQRWTETSCTIENVELKVDQYAIPDFVIKYSYSANGAQRTGTLYETKSNINRSAQYYRNIADDLLPGATVPCFYNPADPSYAVIHPTTYSDGAIIAIPALFIFLGIISLIIQLKARAS